MARKELLYAPVNALKVYAFFQSHIGIQEKMRTTHLKKKKERKAAVEERL